MMMLEKKASMPSDTTGSQEHTQPGDLVVAAVVGMEWMARGT